MGQGRFAGATQLARYPGRTMNDATARPPSRRRSGRPGGHRRSPAPRQRANASEPTRTGNLTTTSTLPPVEAPTGFADLGRAARASTTGSPRAGSPSRSTIQTEAIPVAMHRPRRVRSGQDRLRQDARLRRADAGPHHRRGRAVASRSAWCSCRPVSSPCRSPRCSSPSPPHAGMTRAARLRRRRRATTRSTSSHEGVEIVVATPLRLIDLAQVGRGRSRSSARSSCSTRPTAWPTTGSRRRSSGSCATAPAATRRCCSRRRSTATSAT